MSTRKSSDDRKTEIVNATLDLAFQVGPGQVTTGMIAARLGLSQPALYKHFPRKDDIWLAITQALCTQIQDNLHHGTQAGGPPLAMLRRLVLGHLGLIAATPALPEIMASRDQSSPLVQTRNQVHAAVAEFRKGMRHTLDLAQGAGQLRADLDTGDAEMLIFGVIQSLCLRLIFTHNRDILETDGTRLLDLQLALFAQKGHAA